ncbi:DUF3592 domain-containing protein [Hymenobacter gummosus]|uniref:DUF3592 domain-containing protein n=1 Tax=Hymenobacter gummosus TaxID=1776032 RepID=A0A431TYA1_9BACT|nr:DUF3592 domain-containing protein [Hymenobacter gummosus]RTQ46840.1 DUF3592 domain-containing protein [Hymenobacter gummosus]
MPVATPHFSETSFSAAPLLVLGSLLLGVAALQWRHRTRIRQTGQRTTGTIIRLETDARDDHEYFYPVVEFEHPQGVLTQRYVWGAAGSASYTVGQSVIVFYDPARPTVFVLGTVRAEPTTWLLALMGLGLLLGGICVLSAA